MFTAHHKFIAACLIALTLVAFTTNAVTPVMPPRTFTTTTTGI